MSDPTPREDDLDVSKFKPKPRGGALTLTLGGLVLAGYLLFDLRGSAAYWLAGGTPVDLGEAKGEALKKLSDNAFADVRGEPGPVASRFKRYGRTFEIVALKGTPVLVRRELPGDAPLTGKPDLAPLSASGRLVRDTSIPEYEQAFENLVQKSEAVPAEGHLWVLLDGEKPGTGWRVPAALAGLLALLGFNLYALARWALSRRGAAQQPPG